ncbi:MAG: VCBS repeat-containing protein, partial [Thermoguttaceae bacterium]|nr:VCBS repeat-containing protein [Thermoguttaceae bacterium]
LTERYFHGNGVGDISGDGRADLLEMDGWWEQPEKATDVPWKFHEFHFADAASNMLAYDFDGDGLTDVVTAWHCHQYGLVFWKQVRGADGAISFKEQWLIPTEPGDDFSPKVSQMHALALGDFNGDGVMDFCTGKRRFAHGTKMDSDPMADPVLLWYETVRKDDGSVDFVPHVIDSDSGVGTQVMAQDANGDGIPDILVGNKRGVFVFMSK